MKKLASMIAIFRSERILVLLFCLAAAFRVFIFAAAFPFFSNGDEELHFDLIVQYSAGRLPRTFDVLKSESLSFIGLYGSPEFLQTPDQFPGARFPQPLWKQTTAEAAPIVEATKSVFRTEINWESSQPPLYYILAGLWWGFGQFIGLKGIESLYWIRFLNSLLIAILVWIGYAVARMVEPEQLGLRLGVPLLLAFMPQDVFYVMSNDVLSPICFGVVLLCIIRWFQARSPSLLVGGLTGVAISATYLTKLSNLPLVAVAFAALTIRLLSGTARQLVVALRPLILMIVCAGIPIASWIIWSKSHFGDISGSTTTIALLGWVRKPFTAWWHHPIFSGQGLWTFWSELIARFWRGELMWQNHELSSYPADEFYTISSLLCLGAAMIGIYRKWGLSELRQQLFVLITFSFIAALLFFVLLSIQFDFGNCIYPSRAHPYFTSGRLISGTLIPFSLLYAYGVAYLLRGLRNVVLPLIVIAIVVMVATVSEIIVNREVFTSEHNWFHLAQGDVNRIEKR